MQRIDSAFCLCPAAERAVNGSSENSPIVVLVVGDQEDLTNPDAR